MNKKQKKVISILGITILVYIVAKKTNTLTPIINAVDNVLNTLLSFLKKVEEDNKAALTAYDDGYGTWTIGYGTVYNWDLNRPVQQGDTIDQATADRYLQIEATKDMTNVAAMVTVPITNNQLIALSSFAYNEGLGALRKSTLLKLLNNGSDINTVANEFDKWVYANGQYSKGLYNRRQAEKNLFLS